MGNTLTVRINQLFFTQLFYATKRAIFKRQNFFRTEGDFSAVVKTSVDYTLDKMPYLISGIIRTGKDGLSIKSRSFRPHQAKPDRCGGHKARSSGRTRD